MLLIAEVLDLIERSGIGLLFDKLVSGIDSDNKYERAYSLAAKMELAHASHSRLLTGCKYICKTCVKQLPKREKQSSKKSSEKKLSFFDMEADEEVLEEEGKQSAQIELLAGAPAARAGEVLVAGPSAKELDSRKVPTRALVNGYFRGNTPKCITSLSRMELSMVNLVNIISTLLLNYVPVQSHISAEPCLITSSTLR